MDRTTVQSNKANNKVAKLCHAVRSSFQIIRGIGRGGYIVRKLNKPDRTEFKFMSEDLFILIPSLKPCEPGDGSNIRYSPYRQMVRHTTSNIFSTIQTNTVMLHYPLLQILQLLSLVFPNLNRL